MVVDGRGSSLQQEVAASGAGKVSAGLSPTKPGVGEQGQSSSVAADQVNGMTASVGSTARSESSAPGSSVSGTGVEVMRDHGED